MCSVRSITYVSGRSHVRPLITSKYASTLTFPFSGLSLKKPFCQPFVNLPGKRMPTRQGLFKSYCRLIRSSTKKKDGPSVSPIANAHHRRSLTIHEYLDTSGRRPRFSDPFDGSHFIAGTPSD